MWLNLGSVANRDGALVETSPFQVVSVFENGGKGIFACSHKLR